MQSRVMVVDDERNMLQVLRRCLERNGFSAVAADNASDALMLAREERPDLILSDADMPGLDGQALCRTVKGDPSLAAIPFLLMSGRRIGEDDILSGYEGGADDYLVKPFSLPIMLAKVRTAIRNKECRGRASAGLTGAGLEIDTEGRNVSVKGKKIQLTRKEFDLLALLAAKAGRVQSVNFLLETVWGYDTGCYNAPHTVEVHISQLRRKLGPAIARKIVTMTGYGYKMEV